MTAEAVPRPAGPAEGTARAGRGLRQAVRALRYRNFTLFWSGAFVSNIGTWMQNITVPYVLFQLTNSAAWVGLATFVQFLPGMILAPWAGSVADRFPRRIVLLISQTAAGLVALALWLAWVEHWRSPGLILLLVGAGGCVQGMTVASWQAFVTELVPREDLLNAITLNSAQFNAARAVGPAIGGAALGAFGPSWAFLFNAVSYGAVLVALMLVTVRAVPRARPETRVFGQFAEGVRYVVRHTGIIVAIAMVGAVALLAMPVFTLAPVFAKKVYHVGASGYGWLTAAYGLGAVLGAVLLGSLGDTIKRSRLALIAVLGYSVTLVAFGLAPSFWFGVVALALGGMCFLGSVATLNTSVQLLVAEELRGRVIAVYIMAFTAGYPLGALIQGWMADAIGVQTTVVIAGIVLAVVGGLLVMRPRWLAALDTHTHRGETIVDVLTAP
jgi:MFS family permease